MNYISLIILVLYLLTIVGFSLYSKRLVSTKTTTGFLFAGRSMPWWLTSMMVAGMAVGGAGTVGVAQNAYTAGISAAWYPVSWAFGAIIFGLLVAAKVRKMNISTVTEIFQKAFGTQNALIAISAQVLIMFGINALQIVAGGAILYAILPDLISYNTGLIVSAIIFIITSFFGGFLGASITNILNVFMIYLGLILAVIFSVKNFGGTAAITSGLPDGGHWYQVFEGVGPAVIIGWFIVMAMNLPSNQSVYQAAAASRDEKHAKWGMLIAALIIIPTGILSAYLGIIAASQFPGMESAMALPAVITSLSPVVTGFTLAGLWAADVSTAVALTLGVSTIVTKDVVVKYFKPNMLEEHQVLLSKLLIFLTTGLGLFLAMRVERIIDFMMQLATLYTPLTVMILAILYAPKLIKKSSCSATLISGVIIMVLWATIPATHIVSSPIYLAIPVCLIAFLCTAIFDKRVVDLRVLYDNTAR